MSAFGYRKVSDLPQTAPLFPLAGAVLFPRGVLPLNIFEPRYLNMVDDALAGERLIGMIQPASGAASDAKPALAEIGGLGRITTFAETDDGRYLITLTGVCRFRVGRELPAGAPYREALLDYEDFADDLAAPAATIDREALRAALRTYVKARGFDVDWDAVDEAAPEELVNAVATLCPFDPAAKQALLEAPDLEARAALLVSLLQWGDAPGAAEGRLQ